MARIAKRPQAPCLIAGCDRPANGARGWCSTHYQRWYKYGDPLTLKKPRYKPFAECAADGCRQPAKVREWCTPHYARWLKTGDPAPFVPLTPSERFDAYSQDRPEGGCWLWTGPTGSQGYGVLQNLPRLSRAAHRFAYELFVGPIREGFLIDHLCHNEDLACPAGRGCRHRRCVNPTHLEQVTLSENVRRGALRRAAARR